MHGRYCMYVRTPGIRKDNIQTKDQLTPSGTPWKKGTKKKVSNQSSKKSPNSMVYDTTKNAMTQNTAVATNQERTRTKRLYLNQRPRLGDWIGLDGLDGIRGHIKQSPASPSQTPSNKRNTADQPTHPTTNSTDQTPRSSVPGNHLVGCPDRHCQR